jgi:glutamyl/glutaminyl-tRNA synthetase
MYQALGLNQPQFAHVPLILSQDGGRMSKRYGATSIREYKQEGYLAEAISNYLLLLSWSPGNNREIISLAEAKEIFDIKNVNKTAAAFSMDKLNWVNSEYIKNKSPQELAIAVEAFLKEKNFLPQGITDDYVKKVTVLFKDRIYKLSDLLDWAKFCFYDNYEYAADTGEVLARNLAKEVKVLCDRIAGLSDFHKEAIEKEFRAAATEQGLKAKDLVHPVRVALTGKTIGPGLFETMEVLGKEQVISRLQRLIKYWSA